MRVLIILARPPRPLAPACLPGNSHWKQRHHITTWRPVSTSLSLGGSRWVRARLAAHITQTLPPYLRRPAPVQECNVVCAG